MKNLDGYVRLVEKAKPTYVEPKAYMHIVFSRLRMSFENMPNHQEICQFGLQLAKDTGYNFIAESEESRVVLLSKLEEPISFGSTQNSCK